MTEDATLNISIDNGKIVIFYAETGKSILLNAAQARAFAAALNSLAGTLEEASP